MLNVIKFPLDIPIPTPKFVTGLTARVQQYVCDEGPRCGSGEHENMFGKSFLIVRSRMKDYRHCLIALCPSSGGPSIVVCTSLDHDFAIINAHLDYDFSLLSCLDSVRNCCDILTEHDYAPLD